MAYQQTSCPVLVTLTSKNGIFLVCEPKESTSENACKRKDLERRLSSQVLQTVMEAEPSSCQVDNTTFNVNEVVAVSTSHIKYWQRGLIKKKYGKLWEILLVDWGMTTEVHCKDVQQLPQEFKEEPYFSREAILNGIKPVASEIDHSTTSDPILKQYLAEEFDEATQQFIQDRLYESSETRMTLVAEDQNYWYIRLFLKLKGMDTSFCLNEELCKEGYAVHTTSKQANQEVAQLNEASCKAIYSTSLSQIPSTSFVVGFSDYARNYEKKKREKKMLPLLTQVDFPRMNRSSRSTSPTGTQNAAASRTPSKSTRTMSFGRGKLLAMKDEGDICLSRKSSNCDVARIFNERSHSSQESSKYDSDRSTEFSFPIDDELCSSHDSIHKSVTKSNQMPFPYFEESFQSGKVSAADKSFGSDVSESNSVSMGRGRKLLKLLSKQSTESQYKPAMSKAPPIPSKEIVFPQNFLQKLNTQQTKNLRTQSVAAHPVKPSTHVLSCYPAGMSLNQLQEKPQVNLSSQRERPISSPIDTCISVKSKKEYANKPQSEKFDLCLLLQPETSASCEAQAIKNQAIVAHSPGKNLKRSSRAEVLKAALLRSKGQALFQVGQEGSPVIRKKWEDTRLQAPEMDFTIPVSPEKECVTAPTYSDVDPEELENTIELLELVSGKFAEFSPKKGNSQNFRLSEFVGLLKEGRVLVRTPGTFTSSRDLYDIPFERAIHEALERNGIRQPKILQAYVWKAMLDLSHIAYVAGSKTGKTYGYLVPILNSLLDDDLYTDIPRGCSPQAIVICPTWASVQVAHQYAFGLMNNKIVCAHLEDPSRESARAAIPSLINGVSILTVTAPALLTLLEEAEGVINFDRCCHLVFEDADILLRFHGEIVSKIFERYAESVQRIRRDPKTSHVPRQIVACASHWSNAMRTITKKVLQKPSIFISSIPDAAIYGRMKLHLIRGTKVEMNATVLKIVNDHRHDKIIIFCRDPEEIDVVKHLLLTISAKAIIAHGQSVVHDLNHITYQWRNHSPGNAILLCTDDVLNRLGIQDAQVLIHYFIPAQSKYNFTYRLSFAMGNFHPEDSEKPRPESFILMTDEFKNSLLGIIRLLDRFGYRIPDELRTEAILSYCKKQADKKDLALCNYMKTLGECPDLLLCKNRHIVLKELDQPALPFKNGMVRIRITAVVSATQYYARVLKYCDQDRKLIDMTRPGLELEASIRNYFNREESTKNSVNAFELAVGQIYALKSMEGLYERIRVKEVGERNQLGVPAEAVVFLLDLGDDRRCRISDLFHLPEHLKTISQQAIEIILVGLKPPNKEPSWLPRTVNFVEEKMAFRKGESKEFDGRIVLALSSTLWLQPLHERRKVEGSNALVVVTDIYKDLLDTKQAEKNDDHIKSLYTLAETGGIYLSDYSVGIACKKVVDEPEVRYAFLPLLKKTEVQISCFLSPDQFYVTIGDFRKLLDELEKDILKEVGKFKELIPEEAKPGKLCLARFAKKNAEVWYRSCIKSQTTEPHEWKYQVFCVDYGFSSDVRLEDLKMLPKRFVERLPFQAISCNLNGVKPLNGMWTDEAIGFVNACLKTSSESRLNLLAESLEKNENIDQTIKAPTYSIKLTIPGNEETSATDLTTLLTASNHAVSTIDSTVGTHESSEVKHEKTTETSTGVDEQSSRTIHVEDIQDWDEEEDSFYVSPDWCDYILSSQNSQSNTDIRRNEDATSEKIESTSRIDSFVGEGATGDSQEEPLETSTVDMPPEKEQAADSQQMFEEILAPVNQTMSKNSSSQSEMLLSKESREDSGRISTFFEHIMPFKAALSCFPFTKWYQNRDQVTVTFEIGEINEYDIDISPNCFSFTATVKELKYELNTNTYRSIIPERSSHKKITSGVSLKLQKRNIGEEWIRLMQSPYRPDWLRRDFSRICKYFSDSEEEVNTAPPLVDPKYAFEVDQDSTGSDSSDENFSDSSEPEEI